MGALGFDEFYESFFDRVACALALAGADRDLARDAIATLPVRQRQAVVLRYLADLSIADVADPWAARPEQ